MTANFKGTFTQQLPIPEDAIQNAVAVMRSGRLHRYNVVKGEVPETVLLEQEFAAYIGSKYCLACTSGGYALQTALRAFGIEQGEHVLTNGFTLSPVPGAIAASGGKALFVETTEDLVIDLDDLRAKAKSAKARILLLSHMRGHIVDMEDLMTLAEDLHLAVIEDCAHTMGARWANQKSGTHGLAACFSTQTYKHINSGEGGFIVSNDADLMARATVFSGSYMLYGRHQTVPTDEIFEQIRFLTPNCSGRMDNLRAAILRPQLAKIEGSVKEWNERYLAVEKQLRIINTIKLCDRPPQEQYVGSSIQFHVSSLNKSGVEEFLSRCQSRGVELKWFGDSNPVAYTSRYDSWRYIEKQDLPQTDRVLSRLFDMRIPLTFSLEDCELIGTIIAECLTDTLSVAAGRPSSRI